MANEKIFRVLNGTMTPDVVIDPTLVPSSGEKAALAGSYGTPGALNAFVTTTDTRMLTADQKAAAFGPTGYTPSNTDRFATVQYLQDNINGLDWQNSVQFPIQYVKSTTGAPTGTPTVDGEICLNTFDKKIYISASGAWGAATDIPTGERYVFMSDGSDTSGDSGAYAHDNKIYQYNGTSVVAITLTAGAAFLLESDSNHYTYNGSEIVLWSSGANHNGLSGLDGGDPSSGYYHLVQNDFDAIEHSQYALNSTNPVLSLADKITVPIRYTFVKWNGAGQSQVDAPVHSESGSRQSIVMPLAGFIVGIAVQSSSPRSAGILTAKPSFEGVASTDTELQIQLDSIAPSEQINSIPISHYSGTPVFGSGQKLGAMIDTSATWATTAGNENITIDLYAVFYIEE
jgi:hypothetical protein